jgi:predicted amidohydrolase
VSRLAAVQMNSGADVGANLRAAEAALAQARTAGAALAVLPENFAFMGAREHDKLAVAEADGTGPIQDFLAHAARRHGLWIVGGTAPLKSADPDRVAAACLVYDASGARVARYDKIHLFDVDVPGGEAYRESQSIAPGALEPVVVDTPAGRVGLSVCYDLRFPELFRRLSAAGAEVLAVPSAFTERTGEAHWEPLLRARAIENLCYVVAPGQWGGHPNGRRTWGHSLILDPWGRVLAQHGPGVGAVVAETSREALAALRRGFPVLDHRRL